MKRRGLAIGAGVLGFALAGAARTAAAQVAITRVNVDSNGNQSAYIAFPESISRDGRFVAFDSAGDDLVANDTNQQYDVFVHDHSTGATVRISVDSTGAEGDGASIGGSLSADGRFVAFESLADNLVAGDVNADSDVFLHDRDPDGNGIFDEGNGVTSMVSLNRFGQPPLAGASHQASICADGHLVAFSSSTAGLIFGDTNSETDVFVRDLTTGTTTRASVDSNGNEAKNFPSQDPHLSEDGSAVSFDSVAANLVANDTNGRSDVFVRDLVHGTTTRVSVDSAGNEGDNDSFAGPMTADGSEVVFDSNATDLVSGDTN